ncbi:unnamed protein product [Adineta steineri]|uniref:C3H1-type domain-containing protein n=1 Tax=Adineta steineri TaxID=433720 RepID=A0A819N3W7_9BILA|nr:unnamed protein product [Adineta steineri]
MQKVNDDCFFFLTSFCAKGHTCTYRHNPSVIACNVTCPAWLRGACTDPACSLRHSFIQRPAPPVNNGITCAYENSPTGCLNPNCTFFHLRSRPNSRSSLNVRPSTTNLVNKEVIKPTIVANSPSIPDVIPQQPINELASNTEINSSPIETPSIPVTTVKPVTPPRRIAIPIETEQTETIARNVISDTSEDTKLQTRTTGNRNVVIAETVNIPNRKVVHRVVVASDTNNSSKKVINDIDSDIDLDDLIEPEIDTNKINSLMDISFPCSAPSITNRLFTTSKQSPSTNSTKPIRLNRDRLPAANTTTPKPISPPSNEEKISAGTGLTQDDDRRTSRIERFKKKQSSPTRSVVNTVTRNVINSKRPASEQLTNDSPPIKRIYSQQDNNNNNHHHHQHHQNNNNNNTTIGDLCSSTSSSRRPHERHQRRRRPSSSSSFSSTSSSTSSSPPQRKSPPRQPYSSLPTMNDSAWKNEVDAFLARTSQPKMPSQTFSVLPKPVSLLSIRPQYFPPPPLMQQSSQWQASPRQAPPRQPSRPRKQSFGTTKQPTAPTIISPPKPVEKIPLDNNSPPPPQPPSPISSAQEDENLLLKLDEPTDIGDQFALIDEVLLETEADHLLELM